MGHDGIYVVARWAFAAALVIGMSGCGSSASVDDSAPADEAVVATETSADDGGQDEDSDSDSEPLGSAGAGSILIGGTEYAFTADVCFSESDFLQVSGPGTREDGVPFYGSISVNTNEDYDDDGVLDVAADVTLEFGIDSAFAQAPDDMASYTASLLETDALAFADFEYELTEDRQVSGSGEITDSNYVDSPSGEYVPFEFSGGCT